MRTTTLLLLSLAACAAHAQTTPASLRPDVTVEHHMNVRSNAVRLSLDPVSQQMHYLRTNGDILVVIDDGVTAPYDSLLFTAADQELDQAFGMAFHDSDLFVIGNAITGDLAVGILHRARLRPDGSRIWSVAARTGQYVWGGKGHGFNNVVVSPDGTELYLNCGSRTDHGEVQSVDGAFPGVREEPITAKILRIPIDANDLLLPNNDLALSVSGRVFAYGLRNTFDMAFDAEGRLFGVENSGDHDDPEEMNWLRQGRHYGFPWTAGGNMNPTPTVGYDPVTDPLLNPGYPAAATDFYYDVSFPVGPSFYTEPMLNTGPDADRLRDPISGGMRDASDETLTMHTFTCHRSPLGLVFDNANMLDADLRGDGFTLSFTPGGDTLGFSPIAPWGIPVVPADPSSDLLHLKLEYDQASDNFAVQATRIVEGFYLAVDAELVGNELYVIENSGGSERSIWKVTMPLASGLDEAEVLPQQLNTWPVPSSGVLFWNTGTTRPNAIELLDMSGRPVHKSNPVRALGQLSVDGLAPGAYLLRATFKNSSVCRRVLVTE